MDNHNHTIAVIDDSGRRISTVSSRCIEEPSLEAIPSYIYTNLVFIEDKSFGTHLGVSLRGVARALLVSIKARRILQGGSTITQQLFRTMVPIKNRYVRKLVEFICAPFMTVIYGRKRILGMYLNKVYFGRSIVGISAASSAYLRKTCSELTRLESIVLISLLSRPNYWLKNPNRLAKKSFKVAQMFGVKGVSFIDFYNISRKVSKNSVRLNYAPRWFPKFHEYIIRFSKSNRSIKLTIDSDLQKIILNHVEVKRMNALVAVMDSRTKHLKAVVDCIDIGESTFPTLFSRSVEVGSLLKPVLLMLAAEKGHDPAKLFFESKPGDISFDGFPGWKVRNFGDQYSGIISLEDAVAKSDNVACVKALKYLGYSDFVTLLIENEIIEEHDRSKITPAIVLGACASGVNLIQLMKLYSEFASMQKKSSSLLERVGGVSLKKEKINEFVAVRKSLKKAVMYGTAKSLKHTGVIGAKTGTSGVYQSMIFYDRESIYLIVHKEKVEYILHEQWVSQFDKSYKVTDFAKSLVKDIKNFVKSIVNPNELFGKYRRSA